MQRLSRLAGIGFVLLGCSSTPERAETPEPASKTEPAKKTAEEPQGRGVRRQDKDYADAVLEGEKGSGGGAATP